MQTFLPVPSFEETARILDYRRLGKQRGEARQILNTLRGHGKRGWVYHPAVHMWEGYEEALILYGNVMIFEWKKRGYRNNMVILPISEKIDVVFPPWWGDESFHASHRSNLLRKDPKFYSQYGWEEGPDLPYVWPVRKET